MVARWSRNCWPEFVRWVKPTKTWPDPDGFHPLHRARFSDQGIPMAIVSLDPGELKRLIRQRRHSGGDLWDEVWNGVYVMPPLADNEHQRLGLELAIDIRNVLGPDERIQLFAGCNISDQPKRWRRNYRCPDVAVFLPGNSAEDRGSHWFGGPDFAVEIISRFDRSREIRLLCEGGRPRIAPGGSPPLATGTSSKRR